MATRPDISAAAGKAKQIVSDGQVVQRHSIPDLIEADEHIANQAVVKNRKRRGLLINRVRFGSMTPKNS